MSKKPDDKSKDLQPEKKPRFWASRYYVDFGYTGGTVNLALSKEMGEDLQLNKRYYIQGIFDGLGLGFGKFRVYAVFTSNFAYRVENNDLESSFKMSSIQNLTVRLDTINCKLFSLARLYLCAAKIRICP